jgi:putative tricarboxylic transport membrane protein
LRLADALTGGAVLCGAALLLWQAALLPPMPGQRFGPSTFPTLIALVMGTAGALIVVRGLRTRRGGALVEIGPLGQDRRAQAAFLWLLLGLAAMLLLWRPVGFPLLAACYSLGLMLILGVHPLRAFLWSSGVALAIHLLFTRLLLVPLPPGPLRALF